MSKHKHEPGICLELRRVYATFLQQRPRWTQPIYPSIGDMEARHLSLPSKSILSPPYNFSVERYQVLLNAIMIIRSLNVLGILCLTHLCRGQFHPSRSHRELLSQLDHALKCPRPVIHKVPRQSMFCSSDLPSQAKEISGDLVSSQASVQHHDKYQLLRRASERNSPHTSQSSYHSAVDADSSSSAGHRSPRVQQSAPQQSQGSAIQQRQNPAQRRSFHSFSLQLPAAQARQISPHDSPMQVLKKITKWNACLGASLGAVAGHGRKFVIPSKRKRRALDFNESCSTMVM